MLRKIDEVRDRINVSYSTAKDALEKNRGSVVDAIVYLETRERAPEEGTGVYGRNVWDDVRGEVKEVVEKTKGAKIRVMKDGNPVAEVPAAAGLLGLVGALTIPGGAVVGALGSVAALMNKYSLEVRRTSTQEGVSPSSEKDVDILS